MTDDLKTDRIDEAVLALLHLNICDRSPFGGASAWKSLNWDAMDRLHECGFISDPVAKAKSVQLTDEGLARAEAACNRLFKNGT